jgi:hypothetical protein
MYDCRYDERLEPKDDESTRLAYTGLLEELEYLKIETRLIDERVFLSLVMCRGFLTALPRNGKRKTFMALGEKV